VHNSQKLSCVVCSAALLCTCTPVITLVCGWCRTCARNGDQVHNSQMLTCVVVPWVCSAALLCTCTPVLTLVCGWCRACASNGDQVHNSQMLTCVWRVHVCKPLSDIRISTTVATQSHPGWLQTEAAGLCTHLTAMHLNHSLLLTLMLSLRRLSLAARLSS
jgi:hypothetical protein